MTDNVLKIDQEGHEWLKGCLHNPAEKVTVTFTKKDGSSRIMNCTLAESLIPSNKTPKGDAVTTTPNDEVQKVFDTDIGEWRSFRWDSITAIEVK